MVETIALVTSALALAVSITTAWLAFFHRGKVQMSVPSMVAFGYDASGQGGFDPKIMVRCLLFSTGERGHVIEMAFARLEKDGSILALNTWGIQEEKLQRGGGLFVGKHGVTAWHHFVATGNTRFQFGAGKYGVQVLARVHGFAAPVLLWSTSLVIPDSVVPSRHDGGDQVWFDLNPDTGRFEPRLASRGLSSSRSSS